MLLVEGIGFYNYIKSRDRWNFFNEKLTGGNCSLMKFWSNISWPMSLLCYCKTQILPSRHNHDVEIDAKSRLFS